MRCACPRLSIIVGLAIGAWTPLAFGQESKPEEPALAGPKVEPARATVKTLVHRDFDGKLKRIDGEPVAAALDLLDLDTADRAAADKVLGERAAALDAIMKDNLKEVAELAAARQAGDQARSRELLRDLLTKAGPMFKKGPLVDQVADALPAAKGAELKRIVEEYVQAGIDERLESGTADGMAPRRRPAGGDSDGKPTKMQANIAERLTGFGAEIRRSYERVFGERAKEFQELIKDLGLSPEQESRVQQIFTDLFQKTYGKPTRAQSTKAFVEAYTLMNADQRARLRERMFGRPAGASGGAAKAPPPDVPTPK